MTYQLSWEDDSVPFDVLEGKTLARIKYNADSETIFMETTEGEHFVMGHQQDCCESVGLEETHGDLDDLVGAPIIIAEEASERGQSSEWGDTSTWTFYKMATIKGHVTLRWLGSSNGYYSESVNLYRKKSH